MIRKVILEHLRELDKCLPGLVNLRQESDAGLLEPPELYNRKYINV